MNKHNKPDPTDQRARLAKARLERQRARGSNKFKNHSNNHNGGSRGQSGQPSGRR